MTAAEGRREKLLLFIMPAVVAVLGCGASLLSPETLGRGLTFLAVWTCLSFPLAVLFGHCSLRDD